MLTKKQLEKFVRTRNKSDYAGNMQFGIDARSCGFDVGDLGQVASFTIDGFRGYQWKVETKDGPQELVEFGRTIYLRGYDYKTPAGFGHDTDNMFSMMKKAVFDKAA